jgi:hypothetical protein
VNLLTAPIATARQRSRLQRLRHQPKSVKRLLRTHGARGMGRIGDVNNVIEPAHGGGVHVLHPWGKLYLRRRAGVLVIEPVRPGRLAVG